MRFNDEKSLTAINYYKASNGSTTSRSLSGDDLFDNDFGVGDYVEFIGSVNSYERDLFFTISTAISATSYTGHWEYRYRDGAYVSATVVDGTSGFSSSGDVTWSVKDVYFYNTLQMRYIIDAVDTPTEGGAFTKAKTGDNTIYIENGDDTTFQLMQTENNTNSWNAMERDQVSAIVDRLDHYSIYAQLEIESGGRLADNVWGSATFNVWGGNDIRCYFTVNAGGELQLGDLNANGDGISPFNITTSFGVGHPNAKMAFFNYGTLKLYASSIYSESTNISGSLDIRQGTLDGVNSFNPTVDSNSVGGRIGSTSRGWIEYATSTYNGIEFYNVPRLGVFRGNANFNDCGFYEGWYLVNDRENTLDFVACSPKPNYLSLTTANTTWYWKHRVNVIVIDESDNVVSGATVVCKDVDGNTIFTKTTNASGMIDEQEVIEEQYIGTGVIYTGDGGDTDIKTPHTLTATYGDKSGSIEASICDSYSENSPLVIKISPLGKNVIYDSNLYDCQFN